MWHPSSSAGGPIAQAQAPLPEGTLVTLSWLATRKGLEGVHGVLGGPMAPDIGRTPVQNHLTGDKVLVKIENMQIVQSQG
eukprot:12420730-Karenia_brevis.AAC.1